MLAVRATTTHHQNQCINFIIDSILILLIDMEQNIESTYSCMYGMYKHTPVYSMHVGVHTNYMYIGSCHNPISTTDREHEYVGLCGQ